MEREPSGRRKGSEEAEGEPGAIKTEEVHCDPGKELLIDFKATGSHWGFLT